MTKLFCQLLLTCCFLQAVLLCTSYLCFQLWHLLAQLGHLCFHCAESSTHRCHLLRVLALTLTAMSQPYLLNTLHLHHINTDIFIRVCMMTSKNIRHHICQQDGEMLTVTALLIICCLKKIKDQMAILCNKNYWYYWYTFFELFKKVTVTSLFFFTCSEY